MQKITAQSILSCLTFRDVAEENANKAANLLAENPYEMHWRVAEEINSLLGLHGLEGIPDPPEAYSNCQEPMREVEYFNAGDTYIETVMRVNRRGAYGRWHLGCWGDVVDTWS